MDVIIRKVGEQDGKERFELVDPKSGKVMTEHDASEASIRKYFKAKGLANGFIDQCLQKSRDQFEKRSHQPAKSSAATKSAPASKTVAAKKSEPKAAVSKVAEPKKSDEKKPEPVKSDDDDFLFELGLEDK